MYFAPPTIRVPRKHTVETILKNKSILKVVRVCETFRDLILTSKYYNLEWEGNRAYSITIYVERIR